MELTFVVAVKDIWQLQPPYKVRDQGRSIGKIKFIRNRKMVFEMEWNFLFKKVRNTEKNLKPRTLNGAF